jgi:hypothetical protein
MMTPFLYLIPAVLLANIPCGYWRESVKKFSPQWFVAIHLPVPFIMLARTWLDIDRSLIYLLLIVPACFAGQRLGALLREKRNHPSEAAKSSF